MSPPTAALGDDPRRIREHLLRSRRLALEHNLPSVVVGVAGDETDRLAPEFLAYVESALRVEDAVFRLTRERAVLFLADVDRQQAREILDRLSREFAQRFPALAAPRVALGFFEVAPGCSELQVKDVLPAVFPGASAS
jgi:hypothetical protein